MALRNKRKITLTRFKWSDISNPFQRWKSRLNEPEILVAYIPFLRNIIEYTLGKDENGEYDTDYLTLTKIASL